MDLPPYLSTPLTRPVRMIGCLAKGRVGAALIEVGISRERAERLKRVSGDPGNPLKQGLRLGFYAAARTAARVPGFSIVSWCTARIVPFVWRWLKRRDEAYLCLANGGTATAMLPPPPSLAAQAIPAAPPLALLPALKTRKVHQFHSGSHLGDAVTNSLLVIQRCLRSCGYDSEIFVEHRDPRLAAQLFDMKDMPITDDYVLIVHHSMGHDSCERILSLPAKKILIYHNITPVEFLADFPALIPYAELGRRQLEMLRPQMAFALADSEFNALELRKLGYETPVACPMLFDLDDLLGNVGQSPERAPGVPFTVLFVGRVVASKGQTELIDAFAAFCNEWRAPCRLVLVGRIAAPNSPYIAEVEGRIAEHGLADKVVVTGLVTDDELHAWYRAADLYVSLSYHEGFGVPLVEAMAHGVPVLAWPAGAIPYTLGGGSGLLYERTPDAVAAAMLRLARDPASRAAMITQQRQAIERFRLDRYIPTLVQAIMAAGTAPPPVEVRRDLLAANARFTVVGHVKGTYSLAAITRSVAIALEMRQEGSVRLIAWENGPVAELSDVPPATPPLIGHLTARKPHITGPEIIISHHFPIVAPPTDGDLVLALVFWEESLLPPSTVQVLNQHFGAVLAPSAFVEKVLIDSGVAIPVRNVGQAPELGTFLQLGEARDDRGGHTDRPFTFLHVSSCFPRKGVDALLAAYAKAFRKTDPVRLVIKGFPNPHNDVPEQIADLRRCDPNLAEIVMINQDLDEAGLARLYRDADAVVLPARGEGFNLPAAEAMAAGLPLIVTGFGGQRDFCDDDSARLVDFRFEFSRSHLQTAGSVWVEPDIDDLAKAMWEVLNSAEIGGTAGQRAVRARAAIRRLADTQAWAARIAGAATALLTALPDRPMRVAWVSSWDVRCGIAEYSRLLLERLIQPEADRRPAITMLCDDRTCAAVRADGIRVVPSWRMSDPASMTGLARAISVNDAHIVMIQYQPGFFSWQSLVALLQDPRVSHRIVVVTLHATQRLLDTEPKERIAILAALARVQRILVHQVADLNFLKDLGLTTNVTLFPHGAVRPASMRPIRDLHNWTPALIGCFGFFLPGKGIPRLIEAFARLRATWPALRLRLVNAEYAYDLSKAEIAHCRRLAKDLGIEAAIEWNTEFFPERESRRLLSECDLLVLPYDATKESSSAAVRGALSSGVPVAVTPIPIFAEAGSAVHRFAGIDTDAVAEGVDHLLRHREARQALQDAAMVWLIERDWDVVARRMNGMLHGLHARDVWEQEVATDSASFPISSGHPLRQGFWRHGNPKTRSECRPGGNGLPSSDPD